jgi:hypothetical protein
MTPLLILGTDHVVELTGPPEARTRAKTPLRNGLTGAPVTGATCTCTLCDANGQPLAGGTWPVTLVEAPDAPGIYRGTLPHGVIPAAGTRVTATVIADAGPGLRRTWTLGLVVQRA